MFDLLVFRGENLCPNCGSSLFHKRKVIVTRKAGSKVCPVCKERL